MYDFDQHREVLLPTASDSEIASSFIDSVSAWFKAEEEANRYKVITLCGSHKFREMFSVIKRELTMQGYIVIDPYIFDQDIEHDKQFVEQNEDLLITAHEKRILMSDGIYVINQDGYTGDSVEREIKFAIDHDKFVMTLEYDYRFVKSAG